MLPLFDEPIRAEPAEDAEGEVPGFYFLISGNLGNPPASRYSTSQGWRESRIPSINCSANRWYSASLTVDRDLV